MFLLNINEFEFKAGVSKKHKISTRFSEMEVEKKNPTYRASALSDSLQTKRFSHTWYSYQLIAGSTATNLKFALATKADRQVRFAWN